MESPPVTRPYFSAKRGREIFWLIFCWAVVLITTALLLRYWDWTRSMVMTDYLQQFRTIKPVEYLFQFFTFLGEDEFYMIFFGSIIWCFNKSLGFWTAAVLLVSGLVSGVTKELFALSRPLMDGKPLLDSYAFPSGHTLTAVTVWGYLAIRLKNRWFWIWTLVVMVLTPFSRIILGYHYPGDILGGYAMGFLLLLSLIERLCTRGWGQNSSGPSLTLSCFLCPRLSQANDNAKRWAFSRCCSSLHYRAGLTLSRGHAGISGDQDVIGLAVLFGIGIG